VETVEAHGPQFNWRHRQAGDTLTRMVDITDLARGSPATQLEWLCIEDHNDRDEGLHKDGQQRESSAVDDQPILKEYADYVIPAMEQDGGEDAAPGVTEDPGVQYSQQPLIIPVNIFLGLCTLHQIPNPLSQIPHHSFFPLAFAFIFCYTERNRKYSKVKLR
jgi:hypothetical protein